MCKRSTRSPSKIIRRTTPLINRTSATASNPSKPKETSIREILLRISAFSFKRISGSPERIRASRSSGLSKAVARLRAAASSEASFSRRPVHSG